MVVTATSLPIRKQSSDRSPRLTSCKTMVLYGLLSSIVLLYAGYSSFKAIESSKGQDDTKWLTFWFCYSIFSLAKSVLDYVGSVIPFYDEASLGFIVYLGWFGGSELLYTSLLRPFLLQVRVHDVPRTCPHRSGAGYMCVHSLSSLSHLRSHTRIRVCTEPSGDRRKVGRGEGGRRQEGRRD